MRRRASIAASSFQPMLVKRMSAMANLPWWFMKLWPAFNKVYLEYFKPDRLPARSAFGVNGLALGALLEMECVAYAGR